jgi:hypothetical protein
LSSAREQFVDAMDRVISDARENVGQIGLRIDTVHPACFDDGVDAGRAFSTGVGTTEEIILPTEELVAHSALGGIALDSDYAIWRAFQNNYWPAFYFVAMHGGVFVTSNSARAHMGSQR